MENKRFCRRIDGDCKDVTKLLKKFSLCLTPPYMGNMFQTMEDDPDFDLNGFGPLVAKDGDMPMSTHYDSPVKRTFYIITPDCSNKEAAVQFLNYGYTKEGSLLFNFGIEGESYTMENDMPTYTELIMHNPEGLTKQLAMAQYMRSWSEADASEYSKLIGDIDTYVGEMTIKYITGLESLDTFETEYLETLKSMGVDRAIELQQEALDDFNAR